MTDDPAAAAPPAPDDLPDTTFLLLGLLELGGPSSGYALHKWAQQLVHLHPPPAHSLVYRELRRLARLGFVAAREVRQQGRPDKRVYELRPAGTAALRRWLCEGAADAPTVRDPLLLRLMFGHLLEPAALRRQLRGYREALQQRLGELAVLEEALAEEALDDPARRFPARVAAWGVARTRAELALAEELDAELDEELAEEPSKEPGEESDEEPGERCHGKGVEDLAGERVG